MKKYIFLLLSFLLFAPYVYAIESTPDTVESKEVIEPATVVGRPAIAPSVNIQPVNIFGQEHHYSVTFRGNGEAMVILKAILSNTSVRQLSRILLRVPKVKPEDISIYQVLREKECVRYLSPQPYPGYEPGGGTRQSLSKEECVQYRESDFYQGWGQQTYQKAEYEYSGDTIAITLPRPIPVNASGSYILTYSAFGYAKKNIFGAYEFAFQTPQVEDKIYTLRVGIDTDSDLVLRGGQAYVDYRFDSSSISTLKSVEGSQAISSSAFDNYYQQIGYGQIIKDASDLKTLESYEVKGSYGDGWVRVYGSEIVTGIVILLIVLILLVIIGKYLYRHQRSALSGQKESERRQTPMFLEVLAIGFVSSLVILVYSAVIYFVNTTFLDFSYIGGYFQPLFMLLSMVVSVGVYAFLFFGPTIYIYTKKGLGWAQVQFVTIVVFVMVYLVIFAMFSLMYRNPEMYKIKPLPQQAQMEIQPDAGQSVESSE